MASPYCEADSILRGFTAWWGRPSNPVVCLPFARGRADDKNRSSAPPGCSLDPITCPLTDFQATFSSGQQIAWIQTVFRVEESLKSAHHVERLRLKLAIHHFVLLHADAMLTSNRPAHAEAVFEYFGAGGPGFVQVAGRAGVEQNDGVQVAVARMENIAEGQAVFAADLGDDAQSRGDLGTRHHTVLHVIER